jgi:hypothetical protein
MNTAASQEWIIDGGIAIMKADSMPWWMICGLGAVDGLAVGVLIEALRLMYENHRIELLLQEAAEQNKTIGYILNPTIDLVIPTLSVVVFTGISHLVYRYLISRPGFLLLFWLMAGAIAIAAGAVMTEPLRSPASLVALVLFAGISYLVFRVWRSHLDSLLLGWEVIGVSTVITVAAAAQIVGLFVVQRFELRRPLTWLLCLLLVLVVNFVFGALLRRGFPQLLGKTIHVCDWLPQNTGQTVPPGNLIQTMYNLLENPRCSNFISGLINAARQLTGNKPLSYSAKELIGMIASNPDGGYFFSPGYSGGRGGGDAGYGTGAAGATIGGQSYSPGTPRAAILAIQVGYALTGLHETIHLAGSGYSDKVLAQPYSQCSGILMMTRRRLIRTVDVPCMTTAAFGTNISKTTVGVSRTTVEALSWERYREGRSGQG